MFFFGKPLRSDAEAEEQIGPLQGIPVLGLDAVASASYGPEADRAMRLKAQLLLKGGPHASVMSTPWYPDLSPREAQSRGWAARARRLRPEDV
jgi:hypothetical protein